MKHLLSIGGTLLIVVIGYLVSEQARVKTLGGTMTTRLPAGRKLVNITWKENNVWVLTRPMHQGEEPETYDFAESSSLGLMQGKIVLVESAAAAAK